MSIHLVSVYIHLQRLSSTYLYISPSICTSYIYYSIYLPNYMSINLSLLTVCLTIYIHPFIHLPITVHLLYLTLHIPIHLSVYPSIYLPTTYLPTYLHLSIHPSDLYRHLLHYLPVSPSLYPSTLVFIHLPTYLYNIYTVSTYFSTASIHLCLSIPLSIYISIHLSVFLTAVRETGFGQN